MYGRKQKLLVVKLKIEKRDFDDVSSQAHPATMKRIEVKKSIGK